MTGTHYAIALPDHPRVAATHATGGLSDRLHANQGLAKTGRWQLFIAFLLGFGARLQVQFIGFLPLSEIAVLAIFPFLLPRYMARGALRSTRLLIPLGITWLAFAVITDFYRSTQFTLAARGAARVVVILACIPFAVIFFSKDTYRRLVFFTLGLIPSVVVSAFALRGGVHLGREMSWGRSEINFETHWVALAVFIAQLANLIIYHRSRIVAYGVSLTASGFIFYGGSRAAAAAFATGTPLAWFRRLLASRTSSTGVGGRVSPLAILAFVALTSGAVWGVLAGYSYAASEGLLGERAQRKYQAQSSTPAGLFVTGRLEFVAGLIAVSDSPILGHGSWKLDTDRYYARAVKWLEIRMNPAFYYEQAYPLIPSHSHFVGAWVENGLGGGIFWAYVVLLVVRVFYLPLEDERRLRLWVSCGATALLWHILFSPISSRLETAILLAVFLTQTEAAATIHRVSLKVKRIGHYATQLRPMGQSSLSS